MYDSHTMLFQIYIALSMLLDVSAIILNALIACILKKYKKTSIITFWFIYCLSISDVMVGVTGLMYHSLWLTSKLVPEQSVWNLTATFVFIFHHYSFQISGQLIVIIAVDRYIHMKHLNKYSRIMTQSRSRLILLFSVIFGTLVVIPLYVLSGSLRDSYNFSINVTRATFTLLIYVIYIKTYCSIRRQLAPLQIGKGNNIGPRHDPHKTSEHRNESSCAQNCSCSLQPKLGEVNNSLKSASCPLPCALTQRVSVFQPQNNAFTLPQCSAISLVKDIANGEIPDETREVSNGARFLENDIDYVATNLKVECGKVMDRKQAPKTKEQKDQANQKLQLRKAAPEQDFLKAIVLIFLTLFICYLPFFVYDFYIFATKDREAIMETIALITVLLNSSLNAIILIAFSKEMQRNIKAVFVMG